MKGLMFVVVGAFEEKAAAPGFGGGQVEGASQSCYNYNIIIAGWSSLVARQAHNLKAVGSNPTPAIEFAAQ